MAHDNTFVPFITAGVAAAQDLRSFQHRVVQLTANGVMLARADVASGSTVFVLANKPNSGHFVALNQAPNVTKAVAGEALVRGQLCAALVTSGGFVNAASNTAITSGDQVAIGIAMTAVASGSIVDLKLI